jgi:hypothetical protein
MGRRLIKPLRDIPLMADKVYEMLRCALDAFIVRDAERARAICLMDDEVDALYTQIFEELMSLDVSHQCAMTQANYLLWTAHNLERAADRVTNICERIVYLATGELLQLGDLERLTAEQRDIDLRGFRNLGGLLFADLMLVAQITQSRYDTDLTGCRRIQTCSRCIVAVTFFWS